MADAFGHKYELFIGEPSRLIEVHNEATAYDDDIPPLLKAPNLRTSSLTGGYVDYLTVDATFRKITDPIQMIAKIKYKEPKAGASNPQTAVIKLFNLSDTTLESLVTDALVLLNAGYQKDGEDLPLAFVGTVDHVSTQPEGPDAVTTLLCTEGGNAIKSIRFVDSYPEGRTYNFILLQMIKKFKDNGIPLGRFQESDRTTQSVKEQVAYSGKLAKILTDLCDSLDYVWFICKGKLYVQPKDQPRATEILRITPENIIGKVHPIKNKVGIPSASADSAVKGVKFTTFFNGEVGLQSYVNISEGDFAGDYDIKKLDIHLDWANGPWVLKAETEEVEYYE